jgi:hypothetical protein
VFVAAPLYGSVGSPPSPVRKGMGLVTFVLGLMTAFGLVVYVAWFAVAGLVAVGSAVQHVGGAITGSGEHGVSAPSTPARGAGKAVATVPPVPTRPAGTPSGTTMAFDQLWTSSDGNTIVAGAPTVSTSTQTGESVIRVPVTLTNNGERDWNPVSTTFVGRLNHATVPESTEGDWMYSTPIVPRTSVTLTKVFVTGPGQFTLTMSTPHGEALFSGQV